MSIFLGKYLDFIERINNNYENTINSDQYKSLIVEMIGPESENENNVIYNIMVKKSRIIKKPLFEKISQLFDSQKKDTIDKEYVDIEINYIQLYGGLTFEEKLKNLRSKIIDSVEQYLNNDNHKIDVNNGSNKENQKKYREIKKFIRTNFVNIIWNLFIETCVVFFDDVEDFQDISNKKYREIQEEFQKIYKKYTKNDVNLFYFEEICTHCLKFPIAYIFKYLITTRLACYKNWDTVLYKQNYYLLFILIFELNRYFKIILDELHKNNNIDIIPHLCHYSEKYRNTLIVKGSGPGILCKNLISGINNNGDVEAFESNEMFKTFQYQQIIGLVENANFSNLSEIFSNIVFQFTFYRYEIWLTQDDQMFYDRNFNIILKKTYKKDQSGNYIFSTNDHGFQEEFYKIITSEPLSNLKLLPLNIKKDINGKTLRLSSKVRMIFYSLIFNGCYLHLKEGIHAGHVIGIKFDFVSNGLKVFDPNSEFCYLDKKVRLEIPQNENEEVALIIPENSRMYNEVSILASSDLKLACFEPLYSTLMLQERYFNHGTEKPEFILFNLNAHENTTVKTNVKLFSDMLPNDIIKNGQERLDNSYKYLIYSHSDHRMYYQKRDNEQEISNMYFDSKNFIKKLRNSEFFLFDLNQNLIVHDEDNNKNYILYSYPNYFIDVADLSNYKPNLKIYVFDDGFREYPISENSMKLCCNPLSKFLKFNINVPYIPKEKSKKLKGGMSTDKLILVLLLFILLISIIIVCICCNQYVHQNVHDYILTKKYSY